MSSFTTLVIDPEQEQKFSPRCDTDTHTALTRGLGEFLGQIVFKADAASQQLRFTSVIEDWADPEKLAKAPAAAVYTQEPGIYDDDDFQSSTIDLDGGHVLKICSELTQVICVDIHCASKPQRVELCRQLEDAFEPVDWMSGFRLALPHYYGVHAEFLKVSLDYQDSEESASKQWRVAQFQLEARVSQIKNLGQVPRLQPKGRVFVSS